MIIYADGIVLEYPEKIGHEVIIRRLNHKEALMWFAKTEIDYDDMISEGYEEIKVGDVILNRRFRYDEREGIDRAQWYLYRFIQ